MFCCIVPLPVILSLGFLSHVASSWLVRIGLPTLGWNFWEEYVFEGAREILGHLRVLFRLVRGNLKFAGLMVISLERPSNTSDSGKAVWPANLRSEIIEGGLWWNGVPVSWGAEARVTSGQRNPVGLDCRVGHRRFWIEDSWLAFPCPLRPACELGDCVRRKIETQLLQNPWSQESWARDVLWVSKDRWRAPRSRKPELTENQHQATGLWPAQARRQGSHTPFSTQSEPLQPHPDPTRQGGANGWGIWD